MEHTRIGGMPMWVHGLRAALVHHVYLFNSFSPMVIKYQLGTKHYARH